MTGFLMPLTSRAQSRYALQANRMDSVPPEVTAPHDSGPPLKRLQQIRTISASIFRIPGNASGWSGFVQAAMPYTSVIKLVNSGLPTTKEMFKVETKTVVINVKIN